VTTKPKDDRIVRDGERVRVPLMLMDELQRSVQANRLHDGMGNGAGHKPGFVFTAGRDEAPSRTAHDEYVTDTADAWRSTTVAVPQPTNDAYAAYVAQLSGAWRSP
jgi:hypothetical protein